MLKNLKDLEKYKKEEELEKAIRQKICRSDSEEWEVTKIIKEKQKLPLIDSLKLFYKKIKKGK